MVKKLRFLLMQIRNSDDPMRHREISSFARVIGCDESQISVCDLLSEAPSRQDLDQTDMLLLGGSGRYSAAAEGDWLDRTLDLLRLIHQESRPLFASCWGFQAMARAIGGKVIHDLERAELGTHELRLTPEAKEDPIFAPLGDVFLGQMGHEDRVLELPPDAKLLASTDLVENQAFCFPEKPIYCTQFHPELNRQDLLDRVQIYPEYAERILGMTQEEFAAVCRDAPKSEAIIRRFVKHFIL